MGGGLGRVTNHPEYYLSDGSVSFLTGKTQFRVHKSFFERESEFFRDLFARAELDHPQSGTDALPFTLDVRPDEFAQLLWVWYDREYSYGQQTKDNWLTILSLAKRWEFPKIKELAVRELESLELPAAERISIYTKHDIEGEQLISSLMDLCKSPTVPSEADGHLMQMDTLIKVLQAREDAQRKAVELGHDSPTSGSLDNEALRDIVSKLFKNGLNPRSNGTSTGSGGQAPDLNGERAQRTKASTSTITLEKPQVPDRKPQSASGPKEKQESVRQAKEKEEKDGAEKAKQDKEKEAREKGQRTGQKAPENSPAKA